MRKVFSDYDPVFYVNAHCGAGPYLSYYSGSNTALAYDVVDKMWEISSEMGITPYVVRRMGSTGFAIGDAGSMGISAWLFEILGSSTCWRHTDALYQELVNTYYPKCLAVFLAMCEVCEVEPSYTKKTFEVIVNDQVYPVVTESNSEVTDFYFDGKKRSLRFMVTGQEGTSGFCRVMVPEDLLWGETAVYFDGVQLGGVQHAHNDSHSIFDLSYLHSSHLIEINFAQGIPEFSTLMVYTLILSMLTIFSLLKWRGKIN
jgi:hypothetical protein